MQFMNILKTKNKRLIFIGSIMVIVILILGVYKVYYQKQATADKKLITAVHIASVEQKDLIKNISLVGQTVPKAQVDIAAKYAGRVTSVNAALGQKVTAGQFLIEEDANDAALAVDVNKHAYNQAIADAQTTEVQLDANYYKAKADYDKAYTAYQRNKDRAFLVNLAYRFLGMCGANSKRTSAVFTPDR